MSAPSPASGDASLVGGGVAGIEDVTGGSGDDQLTGNAQDNRLDGGAGNDILVGLAGDDILIGHRTIYDTNATALLALLAEWTSANDYVTRVNHLRTGVGPNGQYRLTAANMRDDLAVDVLTGGADRDWFWKNAVDQVMDLEQGEYVS